MVSHIVHASEIARLREQIDREHKAASWAQTGLAVGTAKHLFVSRRMERIGVCQERLATLVGEQASVDIVMEILEQSPAQQPTQEPAGRPFAQHRPAPTTSASGERPGSIRRRS